MICWVPSIDRSKTDIESKVVRFTDHCDETVLSRNAIFGRFIIHTTQNPHGAPQKRPCFGGSTFKNKGQLGSRYIILHSWFISLSYISPDQKVLNDLVLHVANKITKNHFELVQNHRAHRSNKTTPLIGISTAFISRSTDFRPKTLRFQLPFFPHGKKHPPFPHLQASPGMSCW